MRKSSATPADTAKIAIAIMRRMSLFKRLRTTTLTRLAAPASVLTVGRGKAAWQGNQRGDGLYAVVSGRIKLSAQAARGAEKVIELAGPDEHLGLAAAILDVRSPLAVEALTDSSLLFIPRGTLLAAAADDAVFALRLLDALSRQVLELTTDIQARSLHSGRQRIADFLLQLVANNKASGKQITLPAKKSVIASRLDLTPEYFSRMLHELIVTGVIAVSGRQITILDPVRLGAYGR